MIKFVSLAAALSVLALPAGAVDQRPGGMKGKHERKLANHERIRAAMLRGEILPLQRILATAQQRHRGDVLEVELKVRKDGRLLYEVEILTAGGAVRELTLDPRTGAVISDIVKR